MKAHQIVISTLAVVTVLVGCTSAPSVDVIAEAQKIHELDSLWQAAMTAKDCEATAGFFADEGAMMPSSSPPIVGPAAIQQWFELWLTNPAVISTFTPETIEVAASGDLAYDRGTYQFRMETPEGVIQDDGKYVIVWKKIAGEWKALLDISNSSRQPQG